MCVSDKLLVHPIFYKQVIRKKYQAKINKKLSNALRLNLRLEQKKNYSKKTVSVLTRYMINNNEN